MAGRGQFTKFGVAALSDRDIVDVSNSIPPRNVELPT
jgi:hypothetical protein